MESNQEEFEEELFEIKKLTIDPEISKISEEVTIGMQFSIKKALLGVKWKVSYIIDSTGKRLIIELFETPAAIDYTSTTETYTFQVQTPKLDVENIPRKRLLNVGLLHIEAFNENDKTNLLNLNMVVHVSRDKQDESILLKTVLNPLE